jgi:Tol biopolymer transport system component
MRRLVLVAALASAIVALPSAAGRTDAGAGRGLIVYWSESPWPSIWAIRPDGSQARRLLRNRQNAKRPRLSPDRRWVAFDGTPPGRPPLTDFDVQIVRTDGTGLRTLTRSSQWDHDAQWSPDGRRLAFSRMPPSHPDSRDSTIYVIGRDGRGLRRVTRGSWARWSPDSRRFVLTRPTARSSGDLFIVGADGTVQRRLTATRDIEFAAGWSRDGRRILFTRLQTEIIAGVMVLDVNGGRARKLADGIAAAWSPDESQILYTSSHQLHVMQADGSRQRRLATVRADEPDWR